jgi:hypothetical protein
MKCMKWAQLDQNILKVVHLIKPYKNLLAKKILSKIRIEKILNQN